MPFRGIINDMKLKKPKTIKAPGADSPAGGGGATIADRFKLDVPAKGGTGTVGRTSTAVAFSAALVALALIGGLAAMLYYHWEYLMSV